MNFISNTYGTETHTDFTSHVPINKYHVVDFKNDQCLSCDFKQHPHFSTRILRKSADLVCH